MNWLIPTTTSIAAFGFAILKLIQFGRQGFDLLLDGIILIGAAAIVALIAWLIWALAQ